MTLVAHRVAMTVEEDGTLRVRDLPLRPGERVEVLVLVEAAPSSAPQDPYPLRGKQPYRFDDPFAPAVPIEDWEALRDP